jgi:hypothetical protein
MFPAPSRSGRQPLLASRLRARKSSRMLKTRDRARRPPRPRRRADRTRLPGRAAAEARSVPTRPSPPALAGSGGCAGYFRAASEVRAGTCRAGGVHSIQGSVLRHWNVERQERSENRWVRGYCTPDCATCTVDCAVGRATRPRTAAPCCPSPKFRRAAKWLICQLWSGTIRA